MYVQYVLCILTSLGTADTLLVVGIVAVADQAEPTVVDVHETVGTGLQKPLVPVAFVKQVAGRLVGHGLHASLAGVLAHQARPGRSGIVVLIVGVPLDGRLGHSLLWQRRQRGGGRWRRRRENGVWDAARRHAVLIIIVVGVLVEAADASSAVVVGEFLCLS